MCIDISDALDARCAATSGQDGGAVAGPITDASLFQNGNPNLQIVDAEGRLNCDPYGRNAGDQAIYYAGEIMKNNSYAIVE